MNNDTEEHLLNRRTGGRGLASRGARLSHFCVSCVCRKNPDSHNVIIYKFSGLSVSVVRFTHLSGGFCLPDVAVGRRNSVVYVRIYFRVCLRDDLLWNWPPDVAPASSRSDFVFVRAERKLDTCPRSVISPVQNQPPKRFILLISIICHLLSLLLINHDRIVKKAPTGNYSTSVGIFKVVHPSTFSLKKTYHRYALLGIRVSLAIYICNYVIISSYKIND